MVDTSEEPALRYMQVVARREAPTLLPIIRYYNCVAGLPGVAGHEAVNHSMHGVCVTYWCPHQERGVILEQGEDEAQEDPRMPLPPAAVLLG